MTGRHYLLLLAAAAVALCAVFVLRALDGGDADVDAEHAEAAPPPTPTVVRAEAGALAVPPVAKPVRAARPPAAPSPARTGLEDAEADLRHLAKLLRNQKAINEELLAALDVVQAFYLRPPPPPGGTRADPGLVLDADLRLLVQEQHWPQDYVDEILAWRRKAEKLFLKALKLRRLDRERDLNLREDVNVRAVQVLASTGNGVLSPDIIRTLEKTVLKAKYQVSQHLLDESFAALAQLGHADALTWMRREFIHSKSSPVSHVDQLVAAHAAMRRFDRDAVEGAERHRLVQELIKTYAGVESAALSNERSDRTQTMRRLWDQIRVGVLQALQYFTYDPRTDTGESLVTVAEFQAWFRLHKDRRKLPWKND